MKRSVIWRLVKRKAIIAEGFNEKEVKKNKRIIKHQQKRKKKSREREENRILSEK